MDFLELVRKRRSVRNYLDRPVDDALLERVLEAGRLAPSACNNQPWIFIVIKEETFRQKLENVYTKEWFLHAPAIIAVCFDRSVSWKSRDGRDAGVIDAAIALDHITLAAGEARKTLMLPENIEPVAFTPIGFPGPEEPKQKTRKQLQDIVFRERYGNR
jgi:nitroreductase